MNIQGKNTNIDERQLISERLSMSMQDFSHKPINTEKTLYNLVATGNIDDLAKRKPSLHKKGLGLLSKNPLRNTLYHFIVNASNCARICIDAGMDTETAYTLSDLYIRKADTVSSIDEIEEINYHMMFDYTARMKTFIITQKDYPEFIQYAIQYIDANLHKPIHIDEVANYSNLSIYSFSRRFAKHTGLSFCNYLEIKRIDLAKAYLRYTNLSITEIALNLSFCSSSYFSTRFKEHVGVSPQQFRKKNSASEQ